MTPEQFCYWLQGYAEMGSPAPNEEQWQIIKDHLQLAFKKVTPERVTGPNIASPAFGPNQDWLRQLPPNNLLFQVTC